VGELVSTMFVLTYTRTPRTQMAGLTICKALNGTFIRNAWESVKAFFAPSNHQVLTFA